MREALKKLKLHGRLGALLLSLTTKKYREKMRISMLSDGSKKGLLDYLLQQGLVHQYYQSSPEERMRKSRDEFWSSASGQAWHTQRKGRLPEKSLPKLYQHIEAVLEESKTPRTLLEIGCGNAELLLHLAERYPQLHSVIGIDLNEMQIAANNKLPRQSSVEFVCGEALQEIQRRELLSPLILTHGTLEYFCPEELELFFEKLREISPQAVVILCEPTSFSSELSSSSKPRGFLAYSHSYRVILEAKGFTIIQSDSLASSGSDSKAQLLVLRAEAAASKGEKLQQLG